MINFSAFNIDTNGRTGGRIKTFCPQCHDSRKNKRDKSLSVNLDLGVAYCHYCDWRCNANVKEPAPEKQFRPTLPAVLKDEHVRWFREQRGIPAQVLMDAGITSADEYMPATRRKESCICFNYYEGNRLVNTKFRDLNKNFKLIAGGELIPYNLNGILGEDTCIINEGEIDTLSFMAIGRTDAISIPAGANRNLSWMDRFTHSHFADKKVIYICVDTDRKGQELRDELVRRLGSERCRVIDLSPYKDANEVLLLPDGPERLRKALEDAPEAPLEDVFTAEDLGGELRSLFENGLGSGADTGWENLDSICTFETGRLNVISGIPGCGKSEFLDELVLRLCLRHHWKAAYFSPENMPLTYHLQKLAEKLTGMPFRKGLLTEVQYEAMTDFLRRNITSILPKEDYSIDNILTKSRELINRKGIRQVIIDPINGVDHHIPSGLSETQYLNGLIDRLANFARRNHILMHVVAHPRKMQRDPLTNRTAVPEMYDVNGSAAFFNKCDYGLIVERNRQARVTRVHVEKVKFKHLGGVGKVSFVYNEANGRFMPCPEMPGTSQGSIEFGAPTVDNSSWIGEDVISPDLF